MGDADRTVRLVETDEERRRYLLVMRTAFLDKREVTDEAVAFDRTRWEGTEHATWAAVDGDVQCGTTRTFTSSVRLPGGGAVPVSCLTNVTVLPTHTRRGHLTRMMRTQLEHAADGGAAASLLVAAEWPIYGRFGYGPACWWVDWRVDARRAVIAGAPVGRCEIVDDPAALDPVAADLLARHQAVTPGTIERPAPIHRIVVGLDHRPGDDKHETRVRVVHRDDAGRPDGYVVYDVKDDWDGMVSNSKIEIADLVAVGEVAERELWRYLVDVDLIATVTWNGSPGSVLRSVLSDGRVAQAVGTWDHIWARILDVPRALEGRSYSATGRVVVEVADPFLGRGGRFVLDVSPAGASCAPAGGESAELTVPISALGAAWYGGTDLRTIAASGVVDEHAAGAVDRLAALLSWHQTPWCVTDF